MQTVGGQSIDFYVSTQGNDSWSGTLPAPNPMRTDGPFATIARAQRAVRDLRGRGHGNRGITVAVRKGTYTLSQPITFTPEDSGTPSSPVIYTAYPGEKPIFSGGRRITGWRKGDGGMWTVELPEVKAGKWYFADLYVNNNRRFRPRLPKEGFFSIGDVISADVRDAFVYRPGDLKRWQNMEDLEVVVFNAWDELRFRIAELDEQNRIIKFTGENNWPWRRWEGDNRYYVENVREALDTPGEWYLDRKTGLLTYYAHPGEDPNRDTVIAPVLEELVRFQGDLEGRRYVRHVELRGLAFHHSGWTLPQHESYISIQADIKIPGVIQALGMQECRIENCELAHIGKYGMELTWGCTNNIIRGNNIFDIGAGGIKVGETIIRPQEELHTGHNTIADNHIHDGGKNYLSAVGILLAQTGHNTVARNHIHDLYYTGISLGWTWGYGPSLNNSNVIEYNHMHDLGKGLLSDMGGIYTLGARGNTILRHNLIHDVVAHSYGGWGIYFDEGSSNVLAENNICYNTKTGGFHQHYGKDNIFRNNIIAFSKIGQIQRTRPEEHISFTFENNIVYWTEGPLLHGNWNDDKFRLNNNIYWNADGKPFDFFGRSFEEWKAMGMDTNSIIADPLLMSPETGDFRLRPESPAIKLGFRPFSMKGVPSAPNP